MIRSILVLVLLSTTASAAPTLNPKRTAVIEGAIYGDNLSEVEKAIAKWAGDGSGDAIDLIINSPGGSVTTGFLFINRLRAAKAKVKVNCYVPDVAASMAFQILLHCDNRYVLERSFLLWHRVRVVLGGMFGTAMTAPELDYLGWALQQLDTLILKELNSNLPDMKKDAISYHFEQETLHTGVDLAQAAPQSFDSYPAIEKLYDLLNSKKVPRTTKQELFGVTDLKPGTIFYISPKVSPQFGIEAN